MARTGGLTPYDKLNALSGPARTLVAEDPSSTAIPTSTADVISMVADVNGEYPAKTGWRDLGLAADAPGYSHDKDTSGLEYEQVRGVLFETVESIERQFTAQMAEFDADNLMIIENSDIEAAIAASAALATNKHAGFTNVHTGMYSRFKQYRICMIAYRPEGAGVVTEPGGIKRPPSVARILPLCVLAAEGTDVEVEAGEPTNAEVTFTVIPDSSAGVGKEHGFWSIENTGTILA